MLKLSGTETDSPIDSRTEQGEMAIHISETQDAQARNFVDWYNADPEEARSGIASDTEDEFGDIAANWINSTDHDTEAWDGVTTLASHGIVEIGDDGRAYYRRP